MVRLLLELVVVFVGVYLAFLFNEYRAESEQASHREHLRAALASEIEVFIRDAEPMLSFLDTLLAQWDHAYDVGEQPDPLGVPFGGIGKPPRGMWQAVVESDPLSTLDIATMQSVSEFYNAMDALIERYDRLRSFDEAAVVPHADDGPAAYYGAGSTTLRPEYRAYMSRFHDVANLLRQVRRLAAESRDMLAAPAPP